MTAWMLIVGSFVVAVGLAFVYWPAAVVFLGAALLTDGVLDLTGERS